MTRVDVLQHALRRAAIALHQFPGAAAHARGALRVLQQSAPRRAQIFRGLLTWIAASACRNFAAISRKFSMDGPYTGTLPNAAGSRILCPPAGTSEPPTKHRVGEPIESGEFAQAVEQQHIARAAAAAGLPGAVQDHDRGAAAISVPTARQFPRRCRIVRAYAEPAPTARWEIRVRRSQTPRKTAPLHSAITLPARTTGPRLILRSSSQATPTSGLAPAAPRDRI